MPRHTFGIVNLTPQGRPLKNMMEYAGIDAERIASMEERLKRDVLAEVGAGGQALSRRGCVCGWGERAKGV